MSITLNVMMDSPEEILAKRGLCPGGEVQKFLENTVISFCSDYVPMDTGLLAFSAPKPWPSPGMGQIRYEGPYAHYQYYGVVYGPNIPMMIGGELQWRSPKGIQKKPTGRNLEYSKEKHPLAGPFWLERMKADHLEELEEAVQKMAGAK